MKKSELLSWIWELNSGKPWKIITLMAWVHGDEKSGQIILFELCESLDITSGIVYIISRANPRAITQNIRQTEKNMNRAFHDIPQWSTYEDLRAQEILPILRASDILLDVHNTINTENSIPFLISEHSEWDTYFPVDIVISGLDILHPGGSDGYMNSIGKIWLCIEAGSIHFDDDGLIARESIMNLLRATGNIEWLPTITASQEKYHLDIIIKAKTTEFQFVKKWLDFEWVKQWELIAHDGIEAIYAPYDGVVVFTHATKTIGDEMCVFGKIL